MQKTCRNPWCKQPFEVTDADLDLLDRVSPMLAGAKYALPPPTHCPDCRQQRRLSYRNERCFYRRKCDKTGKEMVSVYSDDKECIVYDQVVWWSDDWDQLATGRAYDFKRPFFEQFHDLSLVAPRPCIVNMSSENSAYTNHSAYNKNCYMCINTGYCEDCFYTSDFTPDSRNCADCLAVQKCERCYECVDCKQCAFSTYLHECINCTNCSFCYDCQGCSDCFGCWNLRHKRYCINNEQLTKDAYEAKLKVLHPVTWKAAQEQCARFQKDVAERALHKALVLEHCENVTGDHLAHCKNCHNCFYVFESEDCAYCYDTGMVKNCLDTLEPLRGELQYESHGCNLGYSLCVCSKCYECKSVLYSQYCWYCTDCFGCFGLRNKKYCIFNKQYTKEEYETLVPKVIDAMCKAGEWGHFFPISLSPFGYNETAAHRYYPLKREAAWERKWRWRDQKEDSPKVSKVIPAAQLPTTIDDTPDDILDWAIECARTKRPFRIVKQELEFYRANGLPIPYLHPDERFQRRALLRNPRHLWKRTCAKCGEGIETTYAPDRPEMIYCEACYLKEVY
ncbi:MAG: hypothetical protein PHN33_04680 [Candidatus Peribacteraceae bacterium]|nr:hypothetical protein [Candidatus Peribacteraceae bacterium]